MEFKAAVVRTKHADTRELLSDLQLQHSAVVMIVLEYSTHVIVSDSVVSVRGSRTHQKMLLSFIFMRSLGYLIVSIATARRL